MHLQSSSTLPEQLTRKNTVSNISSFSVWPPLWRVQLGEWRIRKG